MPPAHDGWLTSWQGLRNDHLLCVFTSVMHVSGFVNLYYSWPALLSNCRAKENIVTLLSGNQLQLHAIL